MRRAWQLPPQRLEIAPAAEMARTPTETVRLAMAVATPTATGADTSKQSRMIFSAEAFDMHRPDKVLMHVPRINRSMGTAPRWVFGGIR